MCVGGGVSSIYQLVLTLIVFLVPIQGLLVCAFSLVTAAYNVSVQSLIPPTGACLCMVRHCRGESIYLTLLNQII